MAEQRPPKLFYIGIILTPLNPSPELAKSTPNSPKPTRELAAVKGLGDFNFLQRNETGIFLSFFAKTVAEQTKINERQDVVEQQFVFHAYKPAPTICGIIITNKAYPTLAAHKILSKVVDDFFAHDPEETWPTLEADAEARKKNGALKVAQTKLEPYLNKYKDPQEIDGLSKIQQELQETKIVLHQTIESVLERGEKLDDLVAKSAGLSDQSKMFYKQAQKQNSCCASM